MGLGGDRHQMGGWPQGPWYTIRETMRLFVRQGDRKEINGYPFTTFTDSSDFLGIIPESLVR